MGKEFHFSYIGYGYLFLAHFGHNGYGYAPTKSFGYNGYERLRLYFISKMM